MSSPLSAANGLRDSGATSLRCAYGNQDGMSEWQSLQSDEPGHSEHSPAALQHSGIQAVRPVSHSSLSSFSNHDLYAWLLVSGGRAIRVLAEEVGSHGNTTWRLGALALDSHPGKTVDPVPGVLCYILCLHLFILMSVCGSLQNELPAGQGNQTTIGHHCFLSQWEEYQKTVHAAQWQGQ